MSHLSGILSYLNRISHKVISGNLSFQSILSRFLHYQRNLIGYGSDFLTGGTATADIYFTTNTPPKAVDNDSNTVWLAFSLPHHWWQYDLGAEVTKVAAKLRIQAPSGTGYNRAPRDFTLLASNTGAYGGEEVTLLTVVDKDWTSGNEWDAWEFANSTGYRYYRIDITEVDGGIYTAMAEVEMMEVVGAVLRLTHQLARKLRGIKTVVGTLLFSSTLSAVFSGVIQRGLSGNALFYGTVTATLVALEESVAGSLVFQSVLALVRRFKRTLSGNLRLGGSVTATVSGIARTLTGNFGFQGSLTTALPAYTLTGNLRFSGTLDAIQVGEIMYYGVANP